MYRLNLKFVALTVPEIIVIGVLGGGCEPPMQRKGEERRWLGMVPPERALASSYRPSIMVITLSALV